MERRTMKTNRHFRMGVVVAGFLVAAAHVQAEYDSDQVWLQGNDVAGSSSDGGLQGRDGPRDLGNNCLDVQALGTLPGGNTVVPYSTAGYTDDFDEDPTCPAPCGWYTDDIDGILSFEMSVPGMWTISACADENDNALQLRQGGACPGDACVASDDDSCGGSCAPPYQAEMTVELVPGVQYYLIVEFGVGELVFTGPCTQDADCDDGNACTDDLCNVELGVCENTPNYDPSTECCDPDTGELAIIDDGNECTEDICDEGTGDVVHPPAPPGTPCGDQSDTECDDPNTCDGGGTCQDNFAPWGAPCGDSTPEGPCDDADTCDGTGICLPNYLADTVVCRPAISECDVTEFCTGDSPECPEDEVQSPGTPCGDPTDTQCDNPDTCDDAGGCLDNYEPEGTPCDDGNPDTDNDACDGNGLCIGDPGPDGEADQEPPTMHEPVGTALTSDGGNDECRTVLCAGGAGGDPVYLFSGEFYFSVIDLQIRGRGLDFVWSRKYRSRLGRHTPQGHGWDFSYNIYIQASGQDIVLFDGNSRRDTYTLQRNGTTWAKDGFFREFTQELDGSYRLTFADTGTWVFNPLDGTPAGGKVDRIVDRNGNTISFDYDSLGRLAVIHDSLDTPAHNRDITIAYNADGFLESVTDFIGRTVTYAYYQNGDAGGSFGDLKSVTSPTVSGTPNGNDFPVGKTTVYTYSTGFTDERLNHNLLTITDPKGQTYLTNIYAATQDPMDLDFDRVMRQIWGDPGDIVDIDYVAQIPLPPDNVVMKVIVNDRVGNVKEYHYDSKNRAVLAREYTGRADPDEPTTETENRPTGKLRPDDPNAFETQWEHNGNSLLTRVVHPNRNEEVFNYDSADPNPRSRGNLLEHCWLPGPLGGDQAEICETFEYDDGFGGCCGTNFVIREVDGRGNETLHEYDAKGNRTHTQHRLPSIVENFKYNDYGQVIRQIHPDNGNGHRRVDVYGYYTEADVHLNGYLKEEIIDAPHDHPDDPPGTGTEFALTTAYEYDPVGNVIRKIDPRGKDALYVVNELNQVVRETSPEVTDGSGVRYERDTYYDANDNVVRRDVQNIDDSGTLQPNTHFTSISEYDILNHRVRTCEEVGTFAVPPGQITCAGLPEIEFLTTAYEYDANGNRTLVRFGEAVEGRQPSNVVRTLHDERDRVFREIRAEGGPDQSTTQHDYDGNGNHIRVRRGLEGTPRTTADSYDGYNRLRYSTDPMGNVTTHHYDANHNRVATRTDGELDDLPGGAGNVRLEEANYEYDAMDRPVRTEFAFFDTATQTPIDDGLSVTENFYNGCAQVIRVQDDNGHATETTYDTANRTSVVTDPKGNTTAYLYDATSNVVAMTEVEKSDLGHPDEEFTTTHTYDNLARLVSATDNVGNTLTYGYDSRHNRTLMTDALGNVTWYDYDGRNRLISTAFFLTDDGTGAGDPIGMILNGQTWDDTSRLTRQIDDHGHATTYSYDALNRLTSTVYADGTEHADTYDVHGNKVTTIDANGSLTLTGYDRLDRLTTRVIIPGSGVSAETTFEVYGYDGLSRLTYAEDDDSLVTRSHDSLSRVTSETLNGQTTTSIYDGMGNRVSCTYPGGRVIATEYDELDRKLTISDGAGPIAWYAYVGPSRVERREYANGTRTEYAYDGVTGVPNPLNDFGVKQVVGTTHSRIADGTILDARTYTWDPMANKTRRKDVRAGGPQLTHDYAYDSAYRLVHTTVTDATTGVIRDTHYALDGVGNRTLVTGGACPGAYQMDPDLPEPGDFQLNQYTTTPLDFREYDANGNLIRIALSSEPPATPAPAPPPHGEPKNRYLSFTPNNDGNRVAFEVELSASDNPAHAGSVGMTWWVGPPDENDVARLVDTPIFSAAWPDVLHLGDCEIVPAAVYEIRATVDGDTFSDSLPVSTIAAPAPKHWADIVGTFTGTEWTGPNGVVNMDDVMAAVQHFVNAPGAPPWTWCDLDGQVPNGVINMTDILRTVQGFQELEYPFSAPADCPAASLPSCPLRAADVVYDYRSQMVEYLDLMTGERHIYAYDALGRRIAKIVDAPMSRGLQPARTPDPPNDALSPLPRGTRGDSSPLMGPHPGKGSIDNPTSTIDSPAGVRYFYNDWQIVEEQDGGGTTQATYVYGLYLDEVLNMRRGGSDYYYHTDDLYNVTAVTDATGTVVERYEYADYGAPEFYDQSAIRIPQSAIGNPYLFTGRRYDPETRWCYYRHRYLDPQTGRFTTRDPVSDDDLLNLYTYVLNAPTGFVDPEGLQTIAVGFETVTSPTWENCGGFRWVVRFHITRARGAAVRPLARATESWVVQRITSRHTAADCNGRDRSLAAEAEMYEAFRISTTGRTVVGRYTYDFGGRVGRRTVRVSGNDTWRVPDMPATRGEWHIHGFCYWMNALPAGAFTPGGVRQAGVLPATRNRPAGLSYTLHRYATSDWDCCRKRNNTQWGYASAHNRWDTYSEKWWRYRRGTYVTTGTEKTLTE